MRAAKPLPLNIQLNHVSDTRKSLVISLDASEVDAEHAAVVAEFARMAKIPGFRPGRAPTAMVAKRFAREIDEEFKQKVVAKAYRSGLEQEKLEVLNVVKVDEGGVAAHNPVTVTVTLDVRPEFTLPEYQGLPTTIEPTEAADPEVDAVIEQMRAERAEFKVVEREAQKSDYLKLSYEGRINGQPVAELVPDQQLYGAVPQTWEEVEGSNEGVIPGLGRHLAGLKPGDHKDVTVEFPAEFPAAPALAGQTAVYSVVIQEVRERVLAPLDDAFFKGNQVENLDQLRDQVRANLKAQKEFQNRTAQRRQVVEALAAKVDFTVPESLVESETQSVLRQFLEDNLRRGIPQEQFEKDKEQLYAGAERTAASRIKVQLLLAKVAQEEKLEVSEGDIDAFIYREARRTQQKPEKLVKALTTDRDQLRHVQQSIIFDKAVDFLVSHATVNPASGTPAAAQ